MRSILISRIGMGLKCLEAMLRKGNKPLCVFSLKEDYKTFIPDYANFDQLADKEGIKNVKIDDIRFWKKIFKKDDNSNYMPSFLRSSENVAILKELKPDICWLLGWGEIINSELLSIPKIGWIGSHPTLLPKYRGGAPLVWPILKGHEKSGCTLIFLDANIDSGDIVAQKEFPIAINETASEIYQKMTDIYVKMIENLLSLPKEQAFPRRPQKKEDIIETWPTRKSTDSEVKWEKPKDSRTLNRYLHDQIRAVSGVYQYAFIALKEENDLLKLKKLIPSLNYSFDSIRGKKIYLKKSEYVIESDTITIKDYEIK